MRFGTRNCPRSKSRPLLLQNPGQLENQNRTKDPYHLDGEQFPSRDLVVDYQARRNVHQAMKPLPAPRAQTTYHEMWTGDCEKEKNDEGAQSDRDEWFPPVGGEGAEAAFVDEMHCDMQRSISERADADETSMTLKDLSEAPVRKDYSQRCQSEHNRQNDRCSEPQMMEKKFRRIGED